jgi:hypothetical protein
MVSYTLIALAGVGALGTAICAGLIWMIRAKSAAGEKIHTDGLYYFWGAFIVALTAALFQVSVMGMMLYADKRGQPPFGLGAQR